MSEKVKRITKQYTKEYKAEAVKLMREIGTIIKGVNNSQLTMI
jgi:transposase-like protein